MPSVCRFEAEFSNGFAVELLELVGDDAPDPLVPLDEADLLDDADALGDDFAAVGAAGRVGEKLLLLGPKPRADGLSPLIETTSLRYLPAMTR